jgi:cytochrome oxidase Cu insertion factor (SCO1/SenC/PrrC family)
METPLVFEGVAVMRVRIGVASAVVLAAVVAGACGDDDGAGLEVGDAAPDFTLPASDGSSVSLGDFDEPVLLYFHMADG